MGAQSAEAVTASDLWGRVRRSAVFYGALATAVRVGANVLLLPLMLRILPPTELGLWYVLLALGGIANLADFGFGQAITRVYSFFWAGAEDYQTEGLGGPPAKQEPNRAGIAQFHQAIRSIYGRVALIATVLLGVVGTFVVYAPIKATANPQLGWACWLGFIVATVYSLGTSYWTLACQGINRVRELQMSHLFGGLAYVISATAMLLAGLGLFSVVAAALVRGWITREMCRRAYLNVVPPMAAASSSRVSETLKRLWPNAWKFGMISLGAYLTIQANTLICSHILGSEMTASYGLTAQLGNIMMAFSALWLSVKWPQITIMRAQGREAQMAALFARRLALVMISLAAMETGVLLLGNAALEWMGSRTRLLPMPFLTVYLFYLFQQQFYVQFGTLAYTENVVPFFKLSVFSGIAVVGFGIMFTRWFGLWGLIMAPLLVTMSSSLWYVTMRGFRGQPLTVRQFVQAAAFKRI